MALEYTIEKRDVKRARLEFRRDSLFIVVPLRRNFDIPLFIQRHQLWIEKKQKQLAVLKSIYNLGTKYERTQIELHELIRTLLEKGFEKLGVKPKHVRFRKMQTRWGSCTSGGVVTLNSHIQNLPENLIWYILYHELCHLKVAGRLFKFTEESGRIFQSDC
jgi:predicted metal-dependent hydrolase